MDYTSRSAAQQSGRTTRARAWRLAAAIALLLTGACSGPQATAGVIQVSIAVDGASLSKQVPSGISVSQALTLAGVKLGQLDRVNPPGYTVLTEGASIQVTRVSEQFVVETSTLPFERQTVRNEGLPEGETRLLQPGANGKQEITYRIVEEQGSEVSRTPVKTIVVQEPVPEIIMVGAQAAFSPVPIVGTLAYLSGGNAWILHTDTGNRRPILVGGDLDGRVFRLSPDGRWLLYTRAAPKDEQGLINSLWVVSTIEVDAKPIDLKADNIIHFADFSPSAQGDRTVAYSTVELSPGSPGWQANNDLYLVSYSSAGFVTESKNILPTNSGGQYGWWGAGFAWAPDGNRLAYARPDGVGLVDLRNPSMAPLLEVVPYQSMGNWAWVPGVAWGNDDRTLYIVDHGIPNGLESPAASPIFDLVALPGLGGPLLTLADRTGMFAYPAVSPPLQTATGELASRVAFLQAVSPLESQGSNYQLVVMDRDGSNRRTLFPPPGETGLAPQQPAWSPDGTQIALTYRGDLWLVDIGTGRGQQVTGDGQTTSYDWKR
jgi:hypothetical protein